MTKTAAKLLTSAPIEVWPHTTLREVAELLERNSIGAALVRGTEGGIAGVISERDLVRAIAEGGDPDSERAGDYMTFDVEFAHADLPVAAVAEVMLRDRIRHLPVEDDEAKVLGVLSIRDVLAAVVGR
jgi:CBS domain-containing protein